jgi:hypothetical protein
VRSGINLADLSANERGFFLGGFGMAKALLFSFMMAAQESGALAPSSPPSKKRGRRKQQGTGQALHHSNGPAAA